MTKKYKEQVTGHIQIHESSIVGLGNEGHGAGSSQIALNNLDFVVLANELDVEWPCQRHVTLGCDRREITANWLEQAQKLTDAKI